MSDLIDWGTTGQIFVESLGAGVLIVAAFALGARLVTSAQAPGAERDGSTGAGAAGAKYALAVLCFTVAAVAVVFGVYFTIDK